MALGWAPGPYHGLSSHAVYSPERKTVIPHIITNMMRDTKRKVERLSNVLMWRFQEGLPEEVAFQAESQRMTCQFGMLWVAHNRKSYQQ